jgi:hypothetical protein
MRCTSRLACMMASAGLALVVAGGCLAQTIRSETVGQAEAATGTVIEGEVRGDDTVDYLVAGEAGQTLSVDLAATNASVYFNILPEGSDEALFIGSTSGNVADLTLPTTGTYVVRVYLMRNAARRDEAAAYALGIGLGGADFADSLAGGPDWWAVSIMPGSALNIRSGPSTRHPLVGKAQNGEVMLNRGCRMTGPDRWCSIRVGGSGVQGWVAGRYLVETAAPAGPEMPEGGPVGEGATFDATGFVACATSAAEPMRSCPFGVVREGLGTAGVWIALGDGVERQILFEAGAPVATNRDGALTSARSGDTTRVRIGRNATRSPTRS